MNGVRFPDRFRLERLSRDHPRKRFASGQAQVDDWLTTKALQNQEKHLSTTRVLLDEADGIAGYFTLTTGQVDFGDLPPEITKRLPKRFLPVAIVAWLGLHQPYQGQGLGRLLLAQALRDCHDAGQTFPFVAVVLDCIDEAARAFYQRFDFALLPGHSNRLFLSARQLAAMMLAR